MEAASAALMLLDSTRPFELIETRIAAADVNSHLASAALANPNNSQLGGPWLPKPMVWN
jgi:hypothetical protein